MAKTAWIARFSTKMQQKRGGARTRLSVTLNTVKPLAVIQFIL
jgi:hypothetical protein